MKRSNFFRLSIYFCLLALLAFAGLPVQAATAAPSTYEVDSTVESNDANPGNNVCADSLNRCSLRAAVQEANAHANDPWGPDRIEVPAGTYHITQKLQIDDAAVIAGEGRTLTIIDGAGSSGPECLDARADLELNDLTVTNCAWGLRVLSTVVTPILVDINRVDFSDNHSPNSSINGSAIYNGCVGCTVDVYQANVYNNSTVNNGGAIAVTNNGILHITQSNIYNNTFDPAADGLGGAIYNNNATLTIHQSQIYNNGKAEDTSGGAIAQIQGDTTIEDSQIYNNLAEYGGAFHVDGGALSALGSQVYENTAGSHGGAIYVYGGGVSDAIIRLTSSILRENAANGSFLAGNGGGAIYNAFSTLIVNYSTIISNTTTGDGGAIFSHDGVNQIANTTISGNRADRSGGGLYATNGDLVFLANVTIANNLADANDDANGKGGGVYINDALSQLQFRNSIIAGNTDLTEGLETYAPDCFGELWSDGYNLVGLRTGLCTITNNLTGLQVGVSGPLDPKLGRLARYSDTAYYHPVLFGPALDRGNPGGCREYNTNNLLVSDQLLHTRPYDPGLPGYTPRCDLGAVESSLPRYDLFTPLLRK